MQSHIHVLYVHYRFVLKVWKNAEVPITNIYFLPLHVTFLTTEIPIASLSTAHFYSRDLEGSSLQIQKPYFSHGYLSAIWEHFCQAVL